MGNRKGRESWEGRSDTHTLPHVQQLGLASGQGSAGAVRVRVGHSECPGALHPLPACFKALWLCVGSSVVTQAGLRGVEESGAEPGGELEPRAGEPGLGRDQKQIASEKASASLLRPGRCEAVAGWEDESGWGEGRLHRPSLSFCLGRL